MPVSVEFLERAAAQTGFQAAALEKVVRLGELAGDVARHPLLGPVLALKGGTALNLCWGVPRRLSVDLDYNFIGTSDRSGMLEARPRVEAAVEEIGRRRGYVVQRSPDAFAGRKIFLRYTSAFGAPDRVEADLNFVFRVPLAVPTTRPLWQPGGLDSPRSLVVSLEELFVGKLMALLDRGAPRDAWDAARLPELAGETLSSPRFRALFLALSATFDHPVTTYSRDRLAAQLSERTIREQLLPMLVAGEAPDPSDLVERAWSVVAPLLNVTTAEAKFLVAIERGDYLPEFLGDPRVVELADHPAIQWKLHNVRERLRRQADGRSPGARPKGRT